MFRLIDPKPAATMAAGRQNPYRDRAVVQRRPRNGSGEDEVRLHAARSGRQGALVVVRNQACSEFSYVDIDRKGEIVSRTTDPLSHQAIGK